MRDQRIVDVADTLVNYSIGVAKGEKIRIVAHDFESKPLVVELIKKINEAGGVAISEFIDHEVQAAELMGSTQERIDLLAKWELDKTENTDGYILIKGKTNDFELQKVEPKTMQNTQKANKKAQNIRVNERKWVLLNYPTQLSANNAKMAMADYEDFFYDVMLVDYEKMDKDSQALKALMDKADKVQIKGPGTDVTFSIKGMGSIVCAGKNNVPDGEVYSCPVKESVNGTVQYNTISFANGIEFKDVKLTIKDGKIVEATSAMNNDKIEDIFNSDEGARYFGEFAIGINPKVTQAVGDILFDEKIYGSFHFTPGQAYGNCYNGNDSVVHWDLVCIQTPEYGGGEILFDDVLIRKDGEFVVDELKALNKTES